MGKAANGILIGIGMILVGVAIVNFVVLPNNIAPGRNWLSDFLFFHAPLLLMITGAGAILLYAIQLLLGAMRRVSGGQEN